MNASIVAGRRTTIIALNEDELVELLRAAKAAGVLASLASTSKTLCRVGRRRLPLRLRVSNKAQAESLLAASARGAGFSGCVELHLEAEDATTCLTVVGILSTAQQWTSLRQLSLSILKHSQQLPPLTLECAAAGVLSAVPALQQLQKLELEVPTLGACSVAPLQRLTQITSLQLTVRDAGAAAGEAAAAGAEEAGNAVDMTALSAMTNLVELQLINPPAVQLAAGLDSPSCLPSSLVTLRVDAYKQATPNPMAGWVAQLPGCPQLQHLELSHGKQAQHHSTHPHAVVACLAQHNRQLRSLSVAGGRETWDASVPGLPDAAGPVGRQWRPTADLAALKGLERLDAWWSLDIAAADWLHVAQLTCLTYLGRVHIRGAPPELVGSRIRLLELEECMADMGGYELGQVLLACPVLQRANIQVGYPAGDVAAGPRLASHPKLQTVSISQLLEWDSDAAGFFAALAPVLAGVSALDICPWPYSYTRQLPDLSDCTALTQLCFFVDGLILPVPEQEGILAMLAPLAHLQELRLHECPRVNARMALVLQYMLPQLRHIQLGSCGRLLLANMEGGEAGGEQQQEEEEQQALVAVQQLLRPGLVLEVDGYFAPDADH